VVLAMLLGCSADRTISVEELERSAAGAKGGEDPRLVCTREHASDPAHAGVVRALCAELHDLGGVSASVAIVREDRVVFAAAVGPRCRGRDGSLEPDMRMRIGSITKIVTTALVIAVAERKGTSLDVPLAVELPELVPAPTLRELLTHTSGLRDPDPMELLGLGDAWLEGLQRHREVAGEHVYANANFLVVGKWLERSTGRGFAELVAEEVGLAGVRALVSFERGAGEVVDALGGVRSHGVAEASDPAAGVDVDAAANAYAGVVVPKPETRPSACGHRPGREWAPVEIAAEPPLPAWTLAAGGGLASAEGLARLPFAFERAGVLTPMLATRVPSDLPGWDYGLGVRVRGEGDALVLAHSGNTGTHWAELQWSPKHRVAVAVMSSTPQAFKATLHAAFEAGMAGAGAMP
jgi:CubicO group peptidase (beta-lactamase class C family)